MALKTIEAILEEAKNDKSDNLETKLSRLSEIVVILITKSNIINLQKKYTKDYTNLTVFQKLEKIEYDQVRFDIEGILIIKEQLINYYQVAAELMHIDNQLEVIESLSSPNIFRLTTLLKELCFVVKYEKHNMRSLGVFHYFNGIDIHLDHDEIMLYPSCESLVATV